MQDLLEMYTRPNKKYTEEEMVNNPNPSILTVGARAVQKHASRPSQYSNYWVEKGSMNGMTEKDKNLKSEKIIRTIFKDSQWLNLHTLYQDSHIYILEVRDALGFGARWEIAGPNQG